MIDPLEEPNPEWDIFPHQPTKAMSETPIQNPICTCFTCRYQWRRGMNGSHECTTLLKSALAASQAEVERLKGDMENQAFSLKLARLSNKAWWEFMEFAFDKPKSELEGGPELAHAIRDIRGENAALKRELEEARRTLQAVASERDGAVEAVEKLKEAHSAYIYRIRDMLGMKTPGDGFINFLEALKESRDQLQSRVVELESRLKNE